MRSRSAPAALQVVDLERFVLVGGRDSRVADDRHGRMVSETGDTASLIRLGLVTGFDPVA